MMECQRGKRNLSMAWIDMRKAYDSVENNWLCAMTEYTGFPSGWVRSYASCVRAGILESTTREGRETSRKIRFMKGRLLS